MVSLAFIGVVVFPAVLFQRLTVADAGIAHLALRTPAYDPVPVVLVVFDEFCGAALCTPERQIDATRFPHFSALQQRSTWYRNAASVSPTTNFALPSILSGSLITEPHARRAQEFPQNLFSLLASVGSYDITAFEPISVLAPTRHDQTDRKSSSVWRDTSEMLRVLGLVYLFQMAPTEFHPRLPVIPNVWFGMHDSRRVDRSARRGTFRYEWTDKRDEQVDHFLQCLDGTPEPVLSFGHFLIPHAPWCYFPSGTRYAEDRDSLDQLCLEDSTQKMADELGEIQNQQRHLMQVMFVDQQVGRLMDRLQAIGIWDRCLLIVTADHGVSFQSGQDRREYTGGNSEDILSIPLFVKMPGQTTGQISDLPVQSTDILPTVLDVIGRNVS